MRWLQYGAIAIFLGALGSFLANVGLVMATLFMMVYAISLAKFVIYGTLRSSVLFYIFLYIAIEFFRRLFFLLPDQLPRSQYVLFTFESITLAVMIWRFGYRERRLFSLQTVDKLWLLFLGINLFNTWISFSVGIDAKLVATQPILFPYFAFVFYRWFARDSANVQASRRLILGLGFFALTYALWQAAFGLTLLDKEWAENSSAFSIVADRMLRASQADEILNIGRIGSFLDNFRFGYLMTTCVFLSVTHWITTGRHFMSSMLFVLVFLFGLILSLSRTPWILLALTFALYVIFRLKNRLRMRFVFPLLVLLYICLSFVPGYLYSNFFGSYSFDNPYLNIATSLGTANARADADKAMAKSIFEHPVLGLGEADNDWIQSKSNPGSVDFSVSVESPDAHNFLVSIVRIGGLPALIVFLLFFYHVLKSGITQMHHYEGRYRRARVWLLAIVGGLFLIGTSTGGGGIVPFYLYWFGLSSSTISRGDIHP